MCVFYHIEICTPHREQDHDEGALPVHHKELAQTIQGWLRKAPLSVVGCPVRLRKNTKPMTPLVRTNNGIDKSPMAS